MYLMYIKCNKKNNNKYQKQNIECKYLYLVLKFSDVEDSDVEDDDSDVEF